MGFNGCGNLFTIYLVILLDRILDINYKEPIIKH